MPQNQNNMNALYKHSIFGLFVVLFLSACGIIDHYEAPKVSDKTAETLFRDHSTKDSSSLADVSYRTFFQDELLQQYIDEGLKNNLNLQIALQNIAIAQASFKQSKQALLPSLYVDPNVTLSKQSKAALNLPPTVNINLRTTTVQLPVGTSWELDVWGKLASAKRSAFASYMQTEATVQATQTQLVATIASYYFQLMALDKQLSITEQTIALRQKDVEALRAMKEASLINGANLAQNEANLYAAEVSLPALRMTIRETENALSVLLGRTPGELPRNTIDQQTFTVDMATGFPLLLVQNRPDVAAAQFRFQSAFEATNVAKASFYPSFNITGRTGLAALTTNTLGANAFFASLVGDLMQPIYNKGVNRANLKRAQAQQQQAQLQFQQQLLVAGSEVSNALFSYETAKEKQTKRELQIKALEQSVSFTKELLTYGSNTNYTDVITAEQSLLNAQLSGVSDQLQQHLALIELYRALGGGKE